MYRVTLGAGGVVIALLIYAYWSGDRSPLFWVTTAGLAGFGAASCLSLLVGSYLLARQLRGVVIERAPGGFALSALKFILPRKTFERLVVQIIGDGREEYFDALQEGHLWHARYITLRTHAILIFSLIFSAFTSTVAKIFSAAWKSIGPG